MAEGRGSSTGAGPVRALLLATGLLAACGGPLRRVPEAPVGAAATATALPGAQARAAYLRGELALARHQPEEALRHFERAALFDPRAAAPRLGQALALEAGGRHAEARVRLVTALERDPSCVPCAELGQRLDARLAATPP